MTRKNDSLDFDYLNPVGDTSSYYSHYTSNYPSPFTNAKPDQQYPQVPVQTMFQSEPFEPVQKSYTRTFSGNDLSASASRCIQRQNSDIPTYCDFAPYDPFQGSPIEITNLSLLESRTSEQVDHPPEVLQATEPSENPTETVQSKRSYKDVLTFPLQSESLISETPIKPKSDNETRKDSYKEKLINTKNDSSPNVKNLHVKSNLNNHRNQPNSHPKKPLKINNNLVGNLKKGNTKSPEKNIQQINDSFKSVRAQTDLNGTKKRNQPISLVDSASFETPTSEDEIQVTSVEVRTKEKIKEKSRTRTRDRENERPSKKHHKRNPMPNHGSALAKSYFPKVMNLCSWLCIWLYNLCADVVHMSCYLSWQALQQWHVVILEKTTCAIDWIKVTSRRSYHHANTNWMPPLREFFRSFRRNASDSDGTAASGGLGSNIPLPSTGEEAMHRLLACRGRDPYSILGVRRDSSDEEIRRYYKRQAVLVHPDKNRQRGAEEAFKILAHAFELIGSPEQRNRYDQLLQEAVEMESAWAELNELISRLHSKMDEAANTIRCTNCAKRHRRLKTERPCYAARYCQDCKIHHSAREGDLWAESRYMGLRSNYYACMEGAVYDITEWANCQVGHLRHLQTNSHRVQYRIVPGQGLPGGHGFGRNKSS